MAKDNKIRLPSGQGGLTRYFDDFKSNIELSPNAIVILGLVMILLIILLHPIGGNFFS